MFDTGATCSYILKYVFKKIVDKINLFRKSFKVNTVRGATYIEEQNFTHNFIVCTKLKQNLILGMDFAPRYKIGIDWDINGKLFCRHEGKK